MVIAVVRGHAEEVAVGPQVGQEVGVAVGLREVVDHGREVHEGAGGSQMDWQNDASLCQ